MEAVIVFFVVIILSIIGGKVITVLVSHVVDVIAGILKGAISLAIIAGIMLMVFPAIRENMEAPITANNSYEEPFTSTEDIDAIDYLIPPTYLVGTEEEYLD